MPRPLPHLRIPVLAAAATLLPWGTSQGTDLPFDPTLTVVLDGVYYDDGAGGDGEAMLGETAGIFSTHGHDGEPGHAGHEHGLEQGFNLRHTEISLIGGIVRIPANVTGHSGDRDRFAHGHHAGVGFVL